MAQIGLNIQWPFWTIVMIKRRFSKIFKLLVLLATAAVVLLRLSSQTQSARAPGNREHLFWEIEDKLRSIQVNLEHRWDFLEKKCEKLETGNHPRPDVVPRRM